MRFTDKEKAVLRLGFVIVDDSKRGKGYGKEMIRLALKYAFEIMKVEKVTIGVFENNASAYHCYQSVGFREDNGNILGRYKIRIKKYGRTGNLFSCIKAFISRKVNHW